MDLNQNNFAHLQNYLTNYWLHNPNLLRASANLRLPIYMNNNYILHQNLLFNQNIIQQQVDLNRRSFPHNYNYGLIQQRGAGDGYSNYSRSQSVNDYNKQSSLCNVSLRSLSPPAESLQEAFRILPRPSITSSCNNLTKDSISHYLEIHKHKTLASEKIRSPSKYEDLHYLGVPYESSLEKFQLFNSIEFNFGPPRKVMSFQRPLILSSEEYYAIREDFACNGVIVNEPEDFNRSISSTSPFTFFGESDFPPLERQASKYFNWNVPSSEVVSLPMQSSNTSIDLIDRENLKKRLKLEKISEDVSSQSICQDLESIVFLFRFASFAKITARVKSCTNRIRSKISKEECFVLD